ncbi:MAG: hypothetical protein WD875_11330 [Pirellulales bacterium]
MARRVRCASCGTENAAASGGCWFCGDTVIEAVVADSALALPGGFVGDIAGRASPDESIRRRVVSMELGLGVLALLAVALSAGAFAISIGLGVTVTLLVAPALVQTSRAVRREAKRGRSVSNVAKTGAFVRSLLLGVAARAAGFATCLSVTLIGLAAGQLMSKLFGSDAFLALLGGLGMVIGVCAGFWVAIKINRQRLPV